MGNATISQILLIFLFTQISADNPFPANITDFKALNAYFEKFFSRKDTETVETWTKKLPTKAEIQEAHQLVPLLYGITKIEDCSSSLLASFKELQKSLQISPFLNRYCVLHEKFPTTSPMRFARAFGYMAVAMPDFVQRQIHHSAAHFQSDDEVDQQAAYLFENTDSRSLIVAGASRFCIQGTSPSERNGSAFPAGTNSTCQPGNTVSDAAHNTNLLFHHYNMAIRDATLTRKESPIFIQWHGMAAESCTKTDAFVSAGAYSGAPVYNDIGTNPNRIVTAVRLITNVFIAGTPKTDPDCNLIAETNVFGRYIYGVPFESLCQNVSPYDKRDGTFIHIEQHINSRNDLADWARILPVAFGNQNTLARNLDTNDL
ncbi:unnamed protein product, partial [Mesorhabditis belari]|uniref:Uncharacterized protein n=1 Tax=Mesorhabditis belari TaxID=2138241 RepID=A0AAF3FIX0_9BILA